MTPGSLMSRIAALGLLGLVGMLVFAGIVLPLQARFDEYGWRIARGEAALARLKARSAGADGLADQLEALQARGLGEDVFLAGASDAVAAASLQRFVKGVIEESGGSVETLQTMESAPIKSFTRVGTRVRARLKVGQLQAVLYRLETATPLAFVEGLLVRQPRLSASRDASADTASSLEVQIDVFGLREGRPRAP